MFDIYPQSRDDRVILFLLRRQVMIFRSFYGDQAVIMQLAQTLIRFIYIRPYPLQNTNFTILEYPKIVLTALPNKNTKHIQCGGVCHDLYFQCMLLFLA